MLSDPVQSKKLHQAPLFAFDEEESRTLFLNYIPINIKKSDLLSHLEGIQGYVHLSMSQPIRSHDF